MTRLKAAYAAATAWLDGNPRKGAAVAFVVGFIAGWIV